MSHLSPDSAEKDFDPKRRAFLKASAAAVVAGTAYGMLPPSTPEHDHTQHQRVTDAAAAIAHQAPELAAEYSVTDLLGAGLLFHGIGHLAQGNSITKWHYGALGALLAAKYHESGTAERAHLKSEIKSNFKALGVIAGTIAIGEGLRMDLTKVCEQLMSEAPDDSTKVALLNMFSTFVAPVITTVGNATIVSKTANELAAGDKSFMAVSVGHSSGRAGYTLFGDPPFIAMIEKYGFKEAVTWQLKYMLPLALYSLFSATLKMNYNLAKRSGTQNPLAVALKQTHEGITKNLGYLTKILTTSLVNAVKYFSGADISKKFGQDSRGIEIQVGSAIASKLVNLTHLPWDKQLDEASSEDFAGRIVDSDDKQWEDRVALLVSEIDVEVRNSSDQATDENQRMPEAKFSDELTRCLLARDFKEAKQLLVRHGIEEAEAEEHVQNFKVSLPLAYSESKEQVSFVRSLIDTILKIPHRTTDIHRVKKALGHNIGDVLNVFPFQANSVPFLLPLLKSFVAKMETSGLSELQREIAIFLIVMTFSMVADNYVAVKMGLDLLPTKPQIPLVAGIEGGELTSIGNMANMAQFSSDQFSLKDSLKKVYMAIDNVGIGMVYALKLGNASIQPTNRDLVAAKEASKGFIGQVLGNQAVEDAVKMLVAA